MSATRRYHFYNTETGAFTGQTFSAPESEAVSMVKNHAPAGHQAIETTGRHIDHLLHKLDLVTHKIVDCQPDSPSADHEWDAQLRQWQLKPEVAKRLLEVGIAHRDIEELERSQPRAVRELLLAIAQRMGVDGGRLQDVDDKIAAHRKVLNGPTTAEGH